MKCKLFKIIYFFEKAIKDFFNPLIYKINIENDSVYLKEYYFIFDYRQLLKGGSYKYKIDKNEIPMVKGHVTDTDGKYYYNPQAVGQFALAVYHEYLRTDEEKYKNNFLRISKWFLNNYRIIEKIPYWPSNQKIVKNVYKSDQNQKISSMSQSRAISVLLRAYQITKDKDYLSLTEKAVNAYVLDINKGGFLEKKEDSIYFEENGKPKILNHMIFSIFGLYDYCRFKDFKTRYYQIYLNSLESIKKILKNYDCGWWSLYDNYLVNNMRRFNPCTRHYHNIHIQQLETLFNLSGDKHFKYYKDKWKEYDDKLINRVKMLKYKILTVKEMGRL